jgi:hypothetical protein
VKIYNLTKEQPELFNKLKKTRANSGDSGDLEGSDA